MADALQYAHEQRLMHRDVKPDNMLLGRRGGVLLTDFGLATIAHRTSSQSMQVMAGTVPFGETNLLVALFLSWLA